MTLADLRKQAGYPSAAKAASKLGVSTVFLYEVERGGAGASDKLIRRIAKLYGASVEKVTAEIQRAQKALLERKLEEMA